MKFGEASWKEFSRNSTMLEYAGVCCGKAGAGVTYEIIQLGGRTWKQLVPHKAAQVCDAAAQEICAIIRFMSFWQSKGWTGALAMSTMPQNKTKNARRACGAEVGVA
ncbi:MAG: hypothetical protein WBQ17_01975 [Rhizomicrobium sp.]|jgi:hypothetical protein